jgi:hypothetical protein
MLHIDIKYICLCGPSLRNFKKKKPSLYNCSCPICGDSEKKKTKARGFFFQKGQSMYYKCHNCSAGMGVGNFLKQLFPSYYDEYLLEKYKSGTSSKKFEEKVVQTTKVKFSALSSKHATKISELDELHHARQYVKNRMIPEEHFSRLYYTQDFAALVDDVFPGKYSNLSKNDGRLVIPFFEKTGGVIGLQGRSLFSDNSLRYITIRATANTDLIYGLDRVDLSKDVYVVEGPIDSLFLPNCVAAANSDLASVATKLGKTTNVILIYDNEPRNKEIVKLMENAISSGHSLCVWPSTLHEKDINEMILSGKDAEYLIRLIRDRTFCRLNAQLEFSLWRLWRTT